MTREQFDTALRVLYLSQMDYEFLPLAEAVRLEDLLHLCRQLDTAGRTNDELLLTKVASHPLANDLLDYLAMFARDARDDRPEPVAEPEPVEVARHEPGSLEEMQEAARSMIDMAAECTDLARAQAALDFAHEHGSPLEVERAQKLVNKLTPSRRGRRR